MIDHPVRMVDSLRTDLRDRPLAEAVDRLLAVLGEGGRFDFAALWGPDERIDRLRPVAVWQAAPGLFPAFGERTPSITFARGEGLKGRVWETATPVFSTDLESEPGYLRAGVLDGTKLRAGVVFPVLADGTVVGIIELCSTSMRSLDPDLGAQLDAVGRELGPALSRRLRAEAVSLEQTRLGVALQAGDMGVWHWDLATNIITWTDTVQAMIGRSGSFVGSVDDFVEVLHPDDRDRVLLAFQSAVEEVARPEVAVRYRVLHDDGVPRWMEARGQAYRDDDGVLVAITGVVSDVTARVRWEESLQRRSQVLQSVNEVGRAITAHLDLASVVQQVTDTVTQHTGAEFGAFFYNVTDPSGERYTLYSLSGAPREAFADFPMPRNTEIFAPTFAGEDVVRLDDVTADPRYGRSAPYHGMPEGHLPVRSYLAVPVVGGDGEVYGGLFLGHGEVGRFTELDEEVAVGIAAQAAVAIANARLYQEALEEAAARQRAFEERDRVARVLQESLLPHALPAADRLEFGARYVARMELVGGDFYDVFPLSGGQWAVAIGDVCGKGPEAAAVTALVRYAVRSTATIVPEPVEVLQFANETLMRDVTDRFCTAAVGLLLPGPDGDVVLRLAHAGHPPALVIRAGGEVHAIGDTGTVLGVLDDARIAQATLVLAPGDALVLYTDGVTDAAGAAGRFGFDRLRAAVAALGGRPAQVIADGIVELVQVHAHVDLGDDVAVLVTVVRPPGPTEP